MDYGRSFAYMFKQPDVWKKILIGGLLLLVPVIGWLWVGGYTLRTLRSVMTGSENLPEWTRWGDLATQGIYVWLGGLIYGLPGAVLGRLGTPGSILSGVWSIVVIVVLPAALMRFAAKGDFGAFFDFNDIFTFINRNLSNYLIVVLLSILAYIIASFGVVLLVIGVLFTSFWGMLVTAHLYGSLASTTGLPLQFGTMR